MFILHLALGGCLKVPPVEFGLTGDTGGHIAYVLGAAEAQAALPDVERISIVTRLFEDRRLGPEYGLASQVVGGKVTIDRVATGRRDYLEKEALAIDLPAFTDAFCRHLDALPQRPDVVHAHFADAAAVALAARDRYGIPFVYTPHALGLDKLAQQAETGGPEVGTLAARIEAERRAIASADAIVVSSRDEADRQVRAYGIGDAAGRTVRLPPGVPRRPHRGGPATVLAGLGERLHDPHKPIVLAIARPVRKKNLVGLVRAFEATPALAARANLVIVAGQRGQAQASAEELAVIEELERLGATPGLRGRVALPPRHSPADVAALYGRAAAGGVFVNCALHEPFGLTLIEAAAAGVPVVATACGGPAEIVETIGHGLLVDPRDHAAIGDACLGIISDPTRHRQLAGAARRNAGRYDWRAYAQGTASLYASLRARATSGTSLRGRGTGRADAA